MRAPRPKARPLILLALAALLALLGATGAVGAKRMIDPNPANDPVLIKKKLDPNRYDGAAGCVRRDPKGMRSLIRWMKRNTKKAVYGTIRCDGGVHSTGRALDWMLDARKKRQKRLAMTVINTWLAKDKRGRPNALARRMGIQLIIYNCRWWQAGDRGWSRYSACSGRNPDPTQGHIDHIHVELTRPAAKLRTSFWQYGTSGGSAGGGSGGLDPSAQSSSRASGHDHPHPPLHPPENEHVEEMLRGAGS